MKLIGRRGESALRVPAMYNCAARVRNAAMTGLAANLVFAEALALRNEVDSALNGDCK